MLDKSQSFPRTHRLDGLWIKSRKLLEKIWPDGPKEELDKIEYYIKEFSKHDPSSEAFRYPIDKKVNKQLNDITHINVRNLKEIVSDLLSLLSGANAGIWEYLDDKFQMMNEMQKEALNDI